jgi:hypothetical protein
MLIIECKINMRLRQNMAWCKLFPADFAEKDADNAEGFVF